MPAPTTPTCIHSGVVQKFELHLTSLPKTLDWHEMCHEKRHYIFPPEQGLFCTYVVLVLAVRDLTLEWCYSTKLHMTFASMECHTYLSYFWCCLLLFTVRLGQSLRNYDISVSSRTRCTMSWCPLDLRLKHLRSPLEFDIGLKAHVSIPDCTCVSIKGQLIMWTLFVWVCLSFILMISFCLGYKHVL